MWLQVRVIRSMDMHADTGVASGKAVICIVLRGVFVLPELAGVAREDGHHSISLQMCDVVTHASEDCITMLNHNIRTCTAWPGDATSWMHTRVMPHAMSAAQIVM